MSSSADLKPSLRSRLRTELKALSAESRAAAAAELCARMNSSAAWQSARAVLLFFPVPSEPDIASLLADALAADKLLALPRFNAATQAYEAVQIGRAHV